MLQECPNWVPTSSLIPTLWPLIICPQQRNHMSFLKFKLANWVIYLIDSVIFPVTSLRKPGSALPHISAPTTSLKRLTSATLARWLFLEVTKHISIPGVAFLQNLFWGKSSRQHMTMSPPLPFCLCSQSSFIQLHAEHHSPLNLLCLLLHLR